MKTLTIIIFILFGFSLLAQEKTAKKLIPNKKAIPKIRVAVKLQKENKAFRDLVNAMQQKGFYPLKLKDWSSAYTNNIKGRIETNDSIFIQIPKNHNWKGKKDATKSAFEDVFFKDAIITEVVLKQKSKSSMRQDIKIMQFIFESAEQAKTAIPKMKKVATFTISVRGLKSPNRHWIYENTIYFCRVRAAAFSTKPFQDTFEKMYGKVEVLRW